MHYFFKYCGGTDAWAVPNLKFWGTVPSVPPKSPPMIRFITNLIKKRLDDNSVYFFQRFHNLRARLVVSNCTG